MSKHLSFPPCLAVVLGPQRLTLLSLDYFWVEAPGSVPEQAVRVRVRFNPTYLGASSLHMRQLKIDIGAPPSVAICREEIYLRVLRDAGERPPAMPFSAWLHQALHSAPARAAA